MTEGQHNSNSKPSKAAASKAPAPRAADATRRENRRRLLKAAAIAAPLMITLRGKPAHAQLSSLGSVGILYGPGAYVTQQDVDANPNVLNADDIGKAIKINGDKKQVLDDKTRRDQKSLESIKSNDPNNPLNGQIKQFPK